MSSSPASPTPTYPGPPPPLHTHPSLPILLDPYNRQILLRGVNLSGDAKVPLHAPLAGTPEFFTGKDSTGSPISYLGRPFANLVEAEEWLRRFKHWGWNCLRIVVVWEALEPHSMGVYDDTYIDSIAQLIALASRLGLYSFLDGHQDVFSRLTGGSGAPAWTFDLVGLDLTNLVDTTTAALDPADATTPLSTPSSRLWPTNYTKMAVATMFTIFFAGKELAPSALYQGAEEEFKGWNVGDVLQEAYVRAFGRLLRRVVEVQGGQGGLLGVDPMNEPHPGYIGLETLARWDETTDLHLGWMPSPIEGMRLAGGEAVEVAWYERCWPGPSWPQKRELRNSGRQRVWKHGRDDIWAVEGVYSPSTGEVDNTYFSRREADFNQLYTSFLTKFYSAITTSHPSLQHLYLFLEPLPNAPPPPLPPAIPRDRIIYSPHWYDIRVLFEKHLTPWISFDVLSLARGSRNLLAHTYFDLSRNYEANFSRFCEKPHHGELPCVVGETGVPVDLNNMGYYHGDVAVQEQMLDAIVTAMERCGLGYSLWNFTLSHTHNHVIKRAGDLGSSSSSRSSSWISALSSWAGGSAAVEENSNIATHQSGDNWNSEDFSLVSLAPHDLRAGIASMGVYRGLRMKRAVVRPAVVAVAGVLQKSEFTLASRRFVVEYIANEVRGGGDTTTSTMTTTTEGKKDAGRGKQKHTQSESESEFLIPRLHYSHIPLVQLSISINSQVALVTAVDETPVRGLAVVAVAGNEVLVRYEWCLRDERLRVWVEEGGGGGDGGGTGEGGDSRGRRVRVEVRGWEKVGWGWGLW
ncbi:glycoside hydrolase [Ascodesmis nigricans]|uniref:Glycoside hydrolase n=1 Tax=Ascodesmis nigricans TaxID=341454 RepID=A0A4S2MIZ0_9PEZI|nr:glycoside hydrolase [Ascodesmis nigricans]